MYIVDTDATPYELVSKANRPGRIVRKLVKEGDVSPGIGFTADLVRYEGGQGEPFSTPRHRHIFNQIRYMVSGTADFGNGQEGSGGQSGYFPAGAYYGPQVINEAEVMLIQWGPDWMNRADHDATYAKMLESGEFKDGYYVTKDEQGDEVRADGRNAVWETFTGKTIVYPTPHYGQPILMDPQGFGWRSAGEGVDGKILGTFSEDEVYVANYQWHDGGVLELTPERLQLMWIISGKAQINGESVGARTVVFSEIGENLRVEGTAETQAVVFGLPTPQHA
ncbi:hypothetical protein [Arthrobacter sp. 18067]|uniref:hypothetical protein n=1 Tax=Arthrobacter sp. 18067 TaxID=2681413 RepID=UPI001357600A|nr:hypothetical protein [Arthrobacter sp. 18067]